MDKRTLAGFRFFRANAGYIVGESAKGALQLAKAERWAKDVASQRFEWRYDEAASDEDLTLATEGVYGCIVWDICPECNGAQILGSLWGIIDPSNDYRRVIEAELALEHMDAETCDCEPHGVRQPFVC
jgi:hypothetical protein